MNPALTAGFFFLTFHRFPCILIVFRFSESFIGGVPVSTDAGKLALQVRPPVL
jgi:hypothetical protein